MKQNRQRLTWMILMGAFGLCLALTVAVPVGINAFRERARKALELRVQTNEGTLGVVAPEGDRDFLAVTDPPQTRDSAFTLITARTDNGLVQIFSPDGSELVARLQVYSDTVIEIKRATTPRFRSSSARQWLEFNLLHGRVRLTIPENGGRRPLQVKAETTQGNVEILAPGQYSLEVSPTAAFISVFAGEATLQTAADTLRLQANQLGALDASGIHGPLSTERNLVVNGNFSAGLDQWVVGGWQVERTDQPAGETTLVEVEGEPALRFQRDGFGHSDASVWQILNQDVTDFKSLRLSLTMRLAQQSLPVCGSVGTECPLTVRLEYEDALGQTKAWQQGLYAVGTISAESPDSCAVCGFPLNLNRHWRVSGLGQVVFFESDNLLERLEQEGIRPNRLKRLFLITAGHTFAVDVIEVALNAQE